jgi:peptidoglycan/xylan/chitin deacetylase (PgdA/CDA1 family)
VKADVPSTRREFLAAAGSAIVLAGCAATRRGAAPATPAQREAPVPSPAPPPPATAGDGTARFVRSGPTGGDHVAFTFHGSGDVGLFGDLLDGARRAGAPITVFAVGSWLDAHPEIAGTILAAGHELANHTYTHPSLGALGRAAVGSEIARCRDVLARQVGAHPGWFRPSGVETPSTLILEEADRAGYPVVVGYDVDPRDYQDPGSDVVLSRVVAGLHPGAIVSLHTGHAGTVKAFEPMVAEARRRRLTPALVRDLVGMGG